MLPEKLGRLYRSEQKPQLSFKYFVNSHSISELILKGSSGPFRESKCQGGIYPDMSRGNMTNNNASGLIHVMVYICVR